jgi:hypothetical protein
MMTKRFMGAVLVGAVISVAVPVTAGAATSGTEHFKLVFNSETGPGAIFASGVFNAGGTDYQGRQTDEAVFPGGTFKIHHASVHTTFQFNPNTCRGTLTGSGPYRLANGYGDFVGIKASGTASLKGTIATGRNANGTCNFHDVSAYALIVHASGPVSF